MITPKSELNSLSTKFYFEITDKLGIPRKQAATYLLYILIKYGGEKPHLVSTPLTILAIQSQISNHFLQTFKK